MGSFKLDKSASLKQQFIGGGALLAVLGFFFAWPLIGVGAIMIVAGVFAAETKK